MIFDLVEKIYRLKDIEHIRNLNNDSEDNKIYAQSESIMYMGDGLHRIYEVRKTNKHIDGPFEKYWYRVDLCISGDRFDFYISPEEVKIVKNETGYYNKETILGLLNEFYDLASSEIAKKLQKYHKEKELNEKLEKDLIN